MASNKKKKSSSAVPPPTTYRDDPSNSYRDIPTQEEDQHDNDDEENVPSVFDWGGGGGGEEESTAKGGGDKSNYTQMERKSSSTTTTGFDPQVEIPFTPISLHDDEDDEEDTDTDSEVSGSNALRPHNGLLSKVVTSRRRKGGGGHAYNPVGSGEDDDDDDHHHHQGRLFVGGGWGRHGSSTDWSPRRFCFGSGSGGSGGLLCSSTGCVLMVFLTLTFLSGYLGYEAGLPVTLNTTTTTMVNDTRGDIPSVTNDDDDDGFDTTQHTTTHGDLWLEWIRNEKNKAHHLPHLHLNFTRRHHNPIITTDSKTNQLQLSFPPMTQSDLLEHSEHLFQSCSERSIATKVGREACLSLCHGHYCCFEKDVEFGSCVSTPNSYCFVYAACENVILDFGFTNINLDEDDDTSGSGGLHPLKKEEMGSVDVDGLDRDDLELLQATCSKENVATLEGIRDCNAFCQHHLCCFSEDAEENCKEEHGEECEAYEPCRIIAEGPEKGGKNSGSGSKSGSGGGGSITVTSEQLEKAVYSACYFGNDESKVTQELVTQCHNMCSSRYCCFESQTIVSSCRDTVGDEECEVYSLCEQMINERGEEVKNFIELDQLEFGAGDSSSSSSSSSSKISGTSYRPGSNGVFVDEAEFEATVNEVHAVCNPDESVDESWVAECHAMCADYLCCFATDGTGSNCKDVHGEDVCEAYYGCKVLQSSTSAPESPISSEQQQQMSQNEQVQIDEVNEVCVPKIRRDAGLRARCEKVCASRDCCWQSGPGNCYVMNTEWCDEYAMCEILDL